MTIHELTLMGKNLKVNLENDYYGEDYWNRIASKEYEPDTQWFVTQNCNQNTDFMDIGAANGAMTLLAAICGAKVFSYEPDPVIFSVLQSNSDLNSDLTGKITLDAAAVSDSQSEITFSERSNPEILSSILFGNNKKSDVKIPVRDLKKELDVYHTDTTRQLVIKMDIEGAEWKILGSSKILQSLRSHNAILLLAVHPGFAKPMPKLATNNAFVRIPWLVGQLMDSLKLFRSLTNHAKIFRTNYNPITNKFKFAMLIIAGYHEYIIKF